MRAPLVAGSASLLTVLVAQPAQAVVDQRCTTGALGSRICIGVQSESASVRGYATLSDPAGGSDLVVTVRSLVLQRRACGGSWQTVATNRTTSDRSTTRDTDVTRYLPRPRGSQFRSVASYSVENAAPPYTGKGGTAVSPAYGAC